MPARRNLGDTITGTVSDGSGSDFGSAAANFLNSAAGYFKQSSANSTPASKGNAQTQPGAGPLASVSTGTVVAVGLGFSALILALAR